MKRLFAVLLGLALALVPALALADDGTTRDDFLMRIRADVHVAAGERIGSIVMIDGNAYIDGDVTNTVFVINGNAIVSGKIGGDLTVISGDINLKDTAQVGNVSSIRGNLVRASDANVSGSVNERDGFNVPAGLIALFSVLFWVAMTVAVVVTGLVFAAIGGSQLNRAAQQMTNAVNVIVGSVFVWVAIPVLAVIAMITLIGIPLGVGALLFLLPALWFLGYIIAGARLGKSILGLTGRDVESHPYASTVLGLVLLQLLVLIPVLGGLLAILAGIWGAGALAFTAYRAAGGKDVDSTPAGQPLTTQQPAT